MVDIPSAIPATERSGTDQPSVVESGCPLQDNQYLSQVAITGVNTADDMATKGPGKESSSAHCMATQAAQVNPNESLIHNHSHAEPEGWERELLE